jgi:hypothetical protein
MTQTIKEQILAIRDTGLTNMFDIPMVQRLAYERDFYELVLLPLGASQRICEVHPLPARNNLHNSRRGYSLHLWYIYFSEMT